MSETTSCPTPAACACAPAKTEKTETSSAKTPTTVQNGKGDAPRNITPRFRKNYDGIKWSSEGKGRKEGTHFVKVY